MLKLFFDIVCLFVYLIAGIFIFCAWRLFLGGQPGQRSSVSVPSVCCQQGRCREAVRGQRSFPVREVDNGRAR